MPHGNIENYITHTDCENCGSEFEKRYTYQKYCRSCELKNEQEAYMKMEVVPWDGEDALYLYESTDQYFFDLDDVTDYCEENETQPEELQLVLCKKTYFSPIDWETIQQEQTHEEWEPSKEFEEKVKEFNNWLTSQNTETWMPTNKRIDISLHL